MSDDEDTVEFGLVMPFIVCQSKGGPYDDAAFVAGYEMGHLAGKLEAKPHFLTRTVHTANMPQVDLLAMRYGYTLTAHVSPDEAWTTCDLKRIAS